MYVILGSNVCVMIFVFVVYWIRKFFFVRKFFMKSLEMRNVLFMIKEFLYCNVFLFFFIIYLSICLIILRIFFFVCYKFCIECFCVFYFKVDYSVKCEGEKYEFFKFFVFGVLFYIVLFLGFVFVVLWRCRR